MEHNQLISFTFFLDMLGFGNKVGHISDQEKAEKFVQFMEENKKIFSQWLQTNETKIHSLALIREYYDFKYAFISDSIVLTFTPKKLSKPLSEKIYYSESANLFYLMAKRTVNLLTKLLSTHKILLRGGISTKYTYIQNEFVVGEGLIEAYKLESIYAINPRIILSKELSDNSQFMDALKVISNKVYNATRLIKCDDDGYFYLNYLGFQVAQECINSDMEQKTIKQFGKQLYENKRKELLETNALLFELHKQAIEDMFTFLRAKKNTHDFDRIKMKYDWIKNYHNSFMTKDRKVFFINLNSDNV